MIKATPMVREYSHARVNSSAVGVALYPRWNMRLLLLALLLVALPASADTLSLVAVCAGASARQVGDDVVLTCPGKPLPFLTLKRCKDLTVPKAERHRLYVDLSPQENSDIWGWANYYAANPGARVTKIVLSDVSAERVKQITQQYPGDQNLTLVCTWF